LYENIKYKSIVKSCSSIEDQRHERWQSTGNDNFMIT